MRDGGVCAALTLPLVVPSRRSFHDNLSLPAQAYPILAAVGWPGVLRRRAQLLHGARATFVVANLDWLCCLQFRCIVVSVKASVLVKAKV